MIGDFRGRSPRLVLTAIAACGLLSGVVAKVSDESSASELADLGTSPTAWVLAVVLLARFAPSPAAAALRCAAFMSAMCVGYYAWASLVLGFPGGGPLLAGWIALALTVVPVGGALVRWSSDRSGVVPGAVLAGAAGIALTDPRVIQLWYAVSGQLPADFPLRPVQGLLGLGTALVITLGVPTRHTTRAWAAASLLPMAYLASVLLEVAGPTLRPS